MKNRGGKVLELNNSVPETKEMEYYCNHWTHAAVFQVIEEVNNAHFPPKHSPRAQ